MGPSNSFSFVPTGVGVLDFVARIYDSSSGDLKRTITSADAGGGSLITVSASDPAGLQSLVYSGADQTADFGASPVSQFDLEVAQIEENGIEGSPRRITLTAPVPPQPVFTNVKLLVEFDGTQGATTAPDLSNSAHVLTFNGGCIIDTADPKYGVGALECPGTTGDFVTAPASTDWDFGLDDFTVECWVKLDTGGVNGFVSRGPSGGFNTGKWTLRYDGNDVDWVHGNNHIVNARLSLVGLGWTHLAVSRSSGTTRLFFNGLQADSSTEVHNITAHATNLLYIGHDPNQSSRIHDGQLDGVRVIKGQGIYVANFTPPLGPHPTS